MVSPRYRIYFLVALLVTYAVNHMDRIVLAVLLPQIKVEMALADWQLGVLTGVAFALFYSVLGLPIARWADSGNRVTIITLAVAVWSLMTAAGGLASNFLQLLLARIGVAIGEAGGTAPAHSIIGDLFSVERRSSAIAVYSLGSVLGASLGVLIGGILGEAFGWRMTLIIIGLPGLLLALVIYVTLREPPRGLAESRSVSTQSAGIMTTVRLLWSRPTYRNLSIGISMAAIAGYGNQLWIPSYLYRSHGLGLQEIGTTLSLVIFTGSTVGVIVGGFLADRLSGRDKRWQMWLPGIGILVTLPFAMLAYLSRSLPLVFTGIFMLQIASMIYMGPAYAITQLLVGLRMRAVASAFTLFLVNILGLGLGPVIIGALSDLMRFSFGNESLRFALIGILVFQVISAILFLRAASTLEADLALAPP